MNTIKNHLGKVFLAASLLLVSCAIYGQGRTFIKDEITKKGQCRNVAITKTNGDVMLYGRNGYARKGCPDGLNRAIDELYNDNAYIDDIQLTEQGRWLVLYGNNGVQWSDIPYSLEQKVREFNGNNEIITSITFNDVGDWIIISKTHYASSDSRITEWLKSGAAKYGMLWAACVTDDAIVAVFENGYLYLGNVPETLKTALSKTTLDVYRLKIAGTSWFFADENGVYQYYM